MNPKFQSLYGLKFNRDRVLYVVHVERGRRDRIISARPATHAERDVYESGDHT